MPADGRPRQSATARVTRTALPKPQSPAPRRLAAAGPDAVTLPPVGTSVTTNPAAFRSTRTRPVPSCRMNQQPAVGHFSTIVPRTVTVPFAGTPARRATAVTGPAGGRPRTSVRCPAQPASSRSSRTGAATARPFGTAA